MKVKFLKKHEIEGQEFTAGDLADIDGKDLVGTLLADDVVVKFTAADERAAKDAEQKAESDRVAKLVREEIEKAKGSTSIPAAPKAQDDASFGFKSLGEFAGEVREWVSGKRPSRLASYAEKAPTAYLNESTDSEGGFAVPEQFAASIWERARVAVDLIAKTDNTNISQGYSMTFPLDAESSRATGSRRGGIRGYWIAEGGQKSQSKPTLKKQRLELHKMVVLTGITDELAADASALSAYLSRAMGEEIAFMVGDAIVNGTGAGMPLGLMNAGCKISVTRDTAATVKSADIFAMYARMYAPSLGRAEWLINQDVYPSLFNMSIAVGTGGGPVYLPPGGLSAAPYGTLMGKPVTPVEWCQTLGTSGDIIFADLSQYRTLTKGGVNMAQSVHLWFDYNVTAYRAEFRIDGQPIWQTALTPYKGSNTQSPIVVLS